MSELNENFERLMEFVKQHNFHKPFSQVYFVEDKSIRRFLNPDKSAEISHQDIFVFENYENRFDEILK